MFCEQKNTILTSLVITCFDFNYISTQEYIIMHHHYLLYIIAKIDGDGGRVLN